MTFNRRKDKITKSTDWEKDVEKTVSTIGNVYGFSVFNQPYYRIAKREVSKLLSSHSKRVKEDLIKEIKKMRGKSIIIGDKVFIHPVRERAIKDILHQLKGGEGR